MLPLFPQISKRNLIVDTTKLSFLVNFIVSFIARISGIVFSTCGPSVFSHFCQTTVDLKVGQFLVSLIECGIEVEPSGEQLGRGRERRVVVF